jgi:enoyl-CoA hydratase/carnithine racemase
VGAWIWHWLVIGGLQPPTPVFGHRGAALGLITGWGGTQRLPKLIGKAQALAMFVSAKKLHAAEALELGLVDGVAEDPLADAVFQIEAAACSSR